jgi:hypothetical protein
MVEILWQFFVMFATESWLSVYVKTRILLGNPDIAIEKSHKKKHTKKVRRFMLWFKRYSSMNMVNFALMLCSPRWICSYTKRVLMKKLKLFILPRKISNKFILCGIKI